MLDRLHRASAPRRTRPSAGNPPYAYSRDPLGDHVSAHRAGRSTSTMRSRASSSSSTEAETAIAAGGARRLPATPIWRSAGTSSSWR